MKTVDIFQTVISVGVVVGMVAGALTYFATAKDLELTQVRLEQKIMADTVMDIKRQMWQLEERNKGIDLTKWKDERDRNEYRKLELQLEFAKKRLEITK